MGNPSFPIRGKGLVRRNFMRQLYELGHGQKSGQFPPGFMVYKYLITVNDGRDHRWIGIDKTTVA